MQKLNQPRVISEILGGICLGPSVLGNIPGFTETIFKKESLGFITTLAGVSLVFYMFIVGLELEPEGFFKYMRHSLVIAAAGMVVPFVLGLACSWGLYKYLLVPNVNNVPFLSFLLFIGLAMSITVTYKVRHIKLINVQNIVLGIPNSWKNIKRKENDQYSSRVTLFNFSSNR